MEPYIYAVLLFLALLLFVAATVELFGARKLLRTGMRTKATMFKNVEEDSLRDNDGDTRRIYKPHFRYFTHEGKELLYIHNVATSWRKWKYGDEAPLVYDPADPEKAKLVSFASLYGMACLLYVIAAGLAVSAALHLYPLL